MNTLEKQRKYSNTIDDFLLFWVGAKISGWRLKIVEGVDLDIVRFIILKIGFVKLCDLTAEMIERAYEIIEKKHGKSDSSLLHVHSTPRTALARASKPIGIAVNPMLSAKP